MTVDINRPDEDTMWKLLKENPGNAVGAILRLSWLQGMTREEICSLTWGDIYTEKKIIALKDREIPLNDDTQQCLHLRITASSNMSPYVVASEKYQDGMASQFCFPTRSENVGSSRYAPCAADGSAPRLCHSSD